MEFKIEHGIPVSKKRFPPRAGKWKKLVDKMKPGDSILVSSQAERSSLGASLRRAGYSWLSRRTEEGFRVWMKDKLKNN